MMHVLGQYRGPRVLMVGEGDFGFARLLAQNRPDLQVIASTITADRETLLMHYPQAAENVDAVAAAGGSVIFGQDATRLNDFDVSLKYDTIGFNFPHINGKQNIKKNRELLEAFLSAARDVASAAGQIKVILCDSQAGTAVTSTTDWKYSWMASVAAAEAGLLLTDVCAVDLQALLPAYGPLGRRGNRGAFSSYDGSNAVLLTFEAPGAAKEVVAVQAPLYSHELHLLSSSMISDVAHLEHTAEAAARRICAEAGHPEALWSCHLVDVYICPQTRLISHALEISYCSLRSPVGRGEADRMRRCIEEKLVEVMKCQSTSTFPSSSSSSSFSSSSSSSSAASLEAQADLLTHYWTVREGKLGGRVSLPHSWQLAMTLKHVARHQHCTSTATATRAALLRAAEVMRGDAAGVQLNLALRSLESERLKGSSGIISSAAATTTTTTTTTNNTTTTSATVSNATAGVARLLWGRRIGVLLNEMCEAEEEGEGGHEEEIDRALAQQDEHENRNGSSSSSSSQNWYVYLLSNPINRRTYLGATNDYTRRLRQHNGDLGGGARYTHMHAPKQWRIHCVVAGLNKHQALSMEAFAKSRAVRPQSQALSPLHTRVASLESLILEQFPAAQLIKMGEAQ